MKIYIMGSTASGKTTLARKLSKKYNIDYYELDKVVYDDDNGHVKRSDKEIQKLFDKILKKDNWIIEDVGRSKFEKGRILSDKIYYIKISKLTILKRVISRWIKQRLKLEEYNYPPTFINLIDMLKITISYFKKESSKLETLEQHKKKVVFLDKKKMKKILEND